MVKTPVKDALLAIYDRLMNSYGPQHWWPADEPFEVMVGAILTQSAAWVNVEKAITSLKQAGMLSPQRLRQVELAELAALIRPSGYYNAKARKLKALVNWFGESYGDDMDRLSTIDTASLRKQLLSIYGIGDETADSILLYAAGKPVFVIDAYTQRIISRLGIFPRCHSERSEESGGEGILKKNPGYAHYQRLFMDNLPPDVRLFNEYHALLVRLGKDACRKQPLCEKCCLGEMCQQSPRRISD